MDELEREYARTGGKGSRSKDRGSTGSAGSTRYSRSTHKTSPAFSTSKSYSERSSRSSSRPHSPARAAGPSSYPSSPPFTHQHQRATVDVFALPVSSSPSASLSTHPQSPLKFPMSPFLRTESSTSSSSPRLSSSVALVLLLVGVGLTMLLWSSMSLPSAVSPAPSAPGMHSGMMRDRELAASKIGGPMQRLIGSLVESKEDVQRLAPESPVPQPPQTQQKQQQLAEQLQPMQQEQQPQLGQPQPQDQDQPLQPGPGLDLAPDADSPVLTPLPRSVGGLASSGFIFDSSYSFVLLAPAPLPPSVRVLAATWARLIARPLTIFSDAPDDELAAFVVVLQDPHPDRARWTGPGELDPSAEGSNLPVEDVDNDQAAEGAEHLHSGTSILGASGRDVIWMLPQAIAHLAAAAAGSAAAAAAASAPSASASGGSSLPPPLDPPAFYFLLTDSRIFPLLDSLHSKLDAYRESLGSSLGASSLGASATLPLPSFVGAGSETNIARESYWNEDADRARLVYPLGDPRSRLTTVTPGLVGFSANFLTTKLAAAAADPQCPLLAPESLAIGGLVACAGGFPPDSALSLFRLRSASPWSLQFNSATTSLQRWRSEGDAYRLGGDSSEESEEAFRAYYEKSEGGAEMQVQMQLQAQ